MRSKKKIGTAREATAVQDMDTSAVADLLENFWGDVLFHDRSYSIWSGAGRIFLTIHDSGRRIAKADWSVDEVDTALGTLRREIMADVENPRMGEKPQRPRRSRHG